MTHIPSGFYITAIWPTTGAVTAPTVPGTQEGGDCDTHDHSSTGTKWAWIRPRLLPWNSKTKQELPGQNSSSKCIPLL